MGHAPATGQCSVQPAGQPADLPGRDPQPPFFDPKADDALNYGGIVAVIGHEMTCSATTTRAAAARAHRQVRELVEPGRRRRLQGAHRQAGRPVRRLQGQQWEGAQRQSHPGREHRRPRRPGHGHDAFTKASAGQPDPKIDGLSRDQRLRRWATVWRRTTPQELDKRLQTDEHALAEYRAIGALSNMPQFAAAFGCKAGDPMVREGDKQVVIW